MVNNALEALAVCDELRDKLKRVRYNPDLHKMLTNIVVMAHDISKKEVECRRLHSTVPLETPLKKINDAIDHLSKLILMAQLMD